MPNSQSQVMPHIGITTGDPAGVGPEISLRAVQEKTFLNRCRCFLFGSYSILESTARHLNLPFEFERVQPESLEKETLCADRYIVDIPAGEVLPGIGSKVTGESAARNVIECHSACRRRQLDAMVTAPLHKKYFQEAGYPFPGHTEFLAHLSSTPEFAMGFLTEKLKVVLATIHLPVQAVLEQIRPDLIAQKLRLILTEFPQLGLGCKKLAVAGLNPHAGEFGLLGSEETDYIEPAIRKVRKDFPEVRIDGPLPADTLFWRAYNGEFDVVLAMYHDQGLAPIKLVGFGEAVNITIGLPFIRTSVDHGTAFDIAGKGIASHKGMMTAIEWALSLSAAKKQITLL
ncbi:MAG: 4-hydroxythreonine-4-phosphate dehydrogenase PdxA [Acidobacteriota bacterium]